MKRYLTSLCIAAVCAYGEERFIHFTTQTLDFDGSKQKRSGMRYATHFGYKTSHYRIDALYDFTRTQTYQPPLPNDLYVRKYFLRYRYRYNDAWQWGASAGIVDDNLAKETDGGRIWGIFGIYRNWQLHQYISDYRRFNVYQSDIRYVHKTHFRHIPMIIAVQGSYIHLQHRKSNAFSAGAKPDYLNASASVRIPYGNWYTSAGAYIGKRMFSVMNDGLGVQHHAMEFDRTAMIAVGRHRKNTEVVVKYIYMRAKEVPIANPNVDIHTVTLGIGIHF